MLNENLTEENNNKPVQQEAFCCISLFVLVKLLGVSLTTLIKYMVGNPLIFVHMKKKKDSDLQRKKLINLQSPSSSAHSLFSLDSSQLELPSPINFVTLSILFG